MMRRGLWIGATVAVLGAVYLGLGLGQGWVRSAIWEFLANIVSQPMAQEPGLFHVHLQLRNATAVDHVADRDLRAQAILPQRG
jgi:hypothetical protein